MHYITTDEEFRAFIERSRGSKELAIDTEFMREKTYYPRLCLLQLGTADDVVLVDPFEVEDLSPLAELFEDQNMVKILHAGRQDIEILHREVGCMPWPVFDTQIAATLLGYQQQIGYGPLVHAECGVSLDKLDSFTDWAKRPLTAGQLSYAADDVVYLPRIYRNMLKQLQEKNRQQWLESDFQELVDPNRYAAEPRKRFIKLKKASSLTRKQLSGARELAAWREMRAQKLDIPRKWVLTDEQIVEACRRECRSIDALFQVRGMREKLSTKDARAVIALLVKGFDAPASSWPTLVRKSRNERNVDAQVDLMSCLVRLRARENDVAYQTLASHDSLQAVARGHYEESDLMDGWRFEVVGKELLDLLDGKLSISVEGKNVVVNRQ